MARRETVPEAIAVRAATEADLERVLALWTRSQSAPSVSDSVQSLRALVRHDPAGLLVAESGGELIGSLLALWNGWRGSLYRLMVHPEHRRRGVARSLVREGERRLRAKGALRLDAIVSADDRAAIDLWRALGYERQHDQARFVRNLT